MIPYQTFLFQEVSDRFFLGPLTADGIVSFHTFKGDLDGFQPDENIHQLELTPIANNEVFQYPVYGEAKDINNRIPDLREQLYWNPQIKVGEDGMLRLQFYTSDVPGEYEMSIEGVSQAGQLISIRRKLLVGP
ncbi:hypothetical protein [Fulvivirga sp. M361]|uniref:hypothetical protein n=1 Tax=Fulvivirga sp. M361 TaxID=2594266 RepID=UPI0016258249|nr:hypothetical protein [Fulvivirga sp. M361]